MPNLRLLLLLIALPTALALGGLTGCGAPQPSGGAGGASGKIRLTYWAPSEVKDVEGLEASTGEYGDWERTQAREYMASHPDVEIDAQALASEEMTKKVTTSIASGAPPDVLRDFLGRTSGYAYQDLLEDFTPTLTAEEKADYDPYYLKLYTLNGRLHGLPGYVWATHVIANRALWEQAGKAELLPPEGGNGEWTVDQFLNAMRAVAVPGKRWPWWAQFSSEQGDYTNYGFFWGHGAFMYAPGDYSRVTLNTPAGADALQLLVNMSKEGLIPPGSTTMAQSELENMVGRGECGAWGDSLFSFLRMQVAQKEGRLKFPVKLQVLQYPHLPGHKSPVPVGPTGFVVFRQSDERKKAAAMEFARWLNRAEAQQVLCRNLREFPTRKSAGQPLADDPNYAVVQRWLKENGRVDLGLTSPGYYKVRVAAIPHIQAAILGQKTPAQALGDFEAEA
ncbi:MAG: ABC transporter substrate-binding protein, partial [Actinomycetota bacterium]